MTWLPNLTFQEAKYAQQTSPQATTLVRNANRYGLRSDAMNAQEIHMKHRPETPLLLGQHKMLYSLGPLPYSTTKAAISKLLKAWQWEARPLQPRGRSQDGNGVQWTIQATSDPSHWIYVLQHGDVLISKLHEGKQLEPTMPYSIVASRRTMQHLQSTGDVDPWIANDPWKQPNRPKQQPTSHHPPPTLPAAAMATLESNVEKRIMSAIAPKLAQCDPDVPMEVDAFESRVSRLEQQLSQVQAHQSTMEQKVYQIDQTVQQVQHSQSSVETSVHQMQHQLDQQSHHITHALDRKMAEQMDKIEALLAKRGRHE